MGPQWVQIYVEVHESGRYRGHSCQLSRFCLDYPDVGSVIAIARYLSQEFQTFAALAHAACRALNNNFIIHDVGPHANSTLEISVQAGEDTMVAPHPKKPKVASKIMCEMRALQYEAKQEAVTFSFCKICSVDAAICTFFYQIQYKLTSILKS